MKKYLSLLLAIAMVLATMAIPVAANNDISLAAVEGNITVSFDASETTVKPGDAITVDVVATAPTSDITVNAGQVDVVFPSESFEYTSLPENVYAMTKAGKTVLSWINEETTQTIATTGTTLFTLNLKVKANAVASKFEVLAGDTLFAYYSSPIADPVDYDVTSAPIDITVAPNTFSVKVDGEDVVENKMYINEAGVKLAVTGTNLETVTLNDSSILVDGEVAEQTLRDGSYTLVVKVVGAEAKTYTFAVTTVVTEATLAIAADKAEYKAGETINVSATIGGLGTKTADMVSFDLEYDATKVEPVAKTGLTFADGKATYVYGNNGETALPNGPVATIGFLVKSDIAYGNTAITLDADSVKISLTGDWSGNDANCTVTTATATVVIVPADDVYGSVDKGEYTTWKDGKAYNITVNPVAGATVKYLASDVEVTATPAEIFAMEAAVEGNTIAIDKDATYYVVAKIGNNPAAYASIATLVNGVDVFFDVTAPVVEINNLSMTDWASAKNGAYTISVTDENWKVTDKFLASTTYGDENVALGEAIVIAQGTNLNGNITITVKDMAGNTTTADVAVKVDSTDPTLELTAGAQVDKKVEITVAADDELSKVKSTVAYYSTAADATEGEVVTIADNKIVADKAGYYYVTVTDNAGNTVTKSVPITIVGSVDAPAITAKTVKGADFAAGFATEAALTGKIASKSNGTFTYVAFNIPEVEGANVVATLNGEAYTSGTEITAADTYVLTVTATSTVDASVTDTDVYNFEVVADQNNMKSINGDARYNIRDYAKIRNIIGTEAEADGLASITEAHAFAAYLAGDLDGNFKMTVNDYAEIIRSLRAGNTPGTYDFAIMNVAKPE